MGKSLERPIIVGADPVGDVGWHRPFGARSPYVVEALTGFIDDGEHVLGGDVQEVLEAGEVISGDVVQVNGLEKRQGEVFVMGVHGGAYEVVGRGELGVAAVGVD